MTVSHYDLHVFPYLSVSLRIVYLFPSSLLFSSFCSFLLSCFPLFSLSLSMYWPFCGQNPVKTTAQTKALPNNGFCCFFLWFFLCSLPKQQKQKTTKQRTILLLSLWSRKGKDNKMKIRKGRQKEGRNKKRKKETKEEQIYVYILFGLQQQQQHTANNNKTSNDNNHNNKTTTKKKQQQPNKNKNKTGQHKNKTHKRTGQQIASKLLTAQKSGRKARTAQNAIKLQKHAFQKIRTPNFAKCRKKAFFNTNIFKLVLLQDPWHNVTSKNLFL